MRDFIKEALEEHKRNRELYLAEQQTAASLRSAKEANRANSISEQNLEEVKRANAIAEESNKLSKAANTKTTISLVIAGLAAFFALASAITSLIDLFINKG